jgi:2-hydroxychromene-2-carboxylate isomerase
MHLIVYGDFNCPYSYLASQRVDAVVRAGQAEVEWRAVEHGPRLALTGTPRSLDAERWKREIAEVAALAGPDEQAPGTAPAMITNTGAAVAAYAEAVTDGVQDELRRSLFSEIWVNRRHLSSPYGVRQLVCALMYPAGTRSEQLAAPDLPSRVHHHAAPDMLPRLSGCTIAPDGGPLTTEGHERIRQWRRGWLSASEEVLPAVSLPDGTLTGVTALAHLADLAAKAPPAVRAPSAAGPRAAVGK